MTLAAGIAIGGAVVSLGSPAPVLGVVPPGIERFDPASVTYFGDTDGVRVWTATLREKGDRCLVAERQGVGGVTCGESSENVAAVEFATGPDGEIVTVRLGMTDAAARPQVSLSMP